MWFVWWWQAFHTETLQKPYRVTSSGMQCFFHLAVGVLILLLPISYAPHVNDGAEHRQVSRYVARWTGRLCCHCSSVYVIIYLWELINYSTTIMARSSQFAWFYCRVLFFSSVSAVCFLPASSQFRLAASIRWFPKQKTLVCFKGILKPWHALE